VEEMVLNIPEQSSTNMIPGFKDLPWKDKQPSWGMHHYSWSQFSKTDKTELATAIKVQEAIIKLGELFWVNVGTPHKESSIYWVAPSFNKVVQRNEKHRSR
jgi:hypothetical protein